MKPQVLLDGKLLDDDRAAISIYDGAFLHGAGLFETMRAYNGQLFRYARHLDRMVASAKALSLPITADILPTVDDARRLLNANDLTDARLRLTVSTGSLRPANPDAPPSMAVLLTAAAATPSPDELYTKGVTVLICPYRQSKHDPLAGHKATAYFARLLALRDAQSQGCTEALWFTTENLLAEGCISNVFTVKGGVLATPPIDTPVLPGVTRDAVLDLARHAGIEGKETAITIDELLDADEVFLTNSSFEVLPITRIERSPIAAESPGPISKTLRADFRALVQQETTSHDGSPPGHA